MPVSLKFELTSYDVVVASMGYLVYNFGRPSVQKASTLDAAISEIQPGTEPPESTRELHVT